MPVAEDFRTWGRFPPPPPISGFERAGGGLLSAGRDVPRGQEPTPKSARNIHALGDRAWLHHLRCSGRRERPHGSAALTASFSPCPPSVRWCGGSQGSEARFTPS